jgi:hypothetical protein
MKEASRVVKKTKAKGRGFNRDAGGESFDRYGGSVMRRPLFLLFICCPYQPMQVN